MPDVILKIEDLAKSFSLGRSHRSGIAERNMVVKDLTMMVEKGKITGLIGGNGAGKTTVFNLINGFLKVDNGKIWFRKNGFDQPCHSMKPHKIARLGIGRMFQGTQLFEELTVMENLILSFVDPLTEVPFYNIFRNRRYRKLMQETEIYILEKVCGSGGHSDLKNLLELKAVSLSFAQQRMLAFVSLLWSKNDLLILDEPTSGVHETEWPWMGEKLKDYCHNGGAVLLIEHNLEFIRNYVEHCYYLSSGKILVEGPTPIVLNQPDVKNDYLS